MDRTYMQEYYAKNKEKMLTKMLTKTQCQLCNRQVNQGFLKQHMQTSICYRNFEKLNNLQKNEVHTLNERINELERLLEIKQTM